jgi:hypothetical protein
MKHSTDGLTGQIAHLSWSYLQKYGVRFTSVCS